MPDPSALSGPSEPAPRRASLLQLLSLTWRESRSARRRLLLYMSAISLGVAALVAIDSFADNVNRSVREQSRALLGGDVAFRARQPFTDPQKALLDSFAQASGARYARVVTFPSMAFVSRTGGTRLSQIRAVSDNYPFYGEITIKNGAVEQGNFHDYRMLKLAQMPKVEVVLVPSGGFWGGCGEPPVAIVA